VPNKTRARMTDDGDGGATGAQVEWTPKCGWKLRRPKRGRKLRRLRLGLGGGGVFQTASGHPHGWVNVDVPALLVPGKLGLAEDHFKNSVYLFNVGARLPPEEVGSRRVRSALLSFVSESLSYPQQVS
jgi:hypothetical protein